MRMSTVTRTALLCSVGPALLVAAPSAAQAVDGTPVASTDIIVTATKREERLADVGTAITALGQEELDNRALRTIEQLAAQVPGLNFQPGGPANVRLILRGLNTGGQGATAAVVVDETPFTMQSALSGGSTLTANIDTYDMARIEVLKGPQGTLYGATAQGGLLRYVTNLPDSTRLSASTELGTQINADGGLGYSLRGMLNVPVIRDVLAIRAVGYYEETPGYIRNPTLGTSEINGGERWGGRVSVLFTPTDRVSLRVTALRQEQEFGDNDTVEFVGGGADPFNPPENQFDLVNGRPQRNTLYGAVSSNLYEFVNLTGEFDFGFADFTSSTSLGRLEVNNQFDISFAGPAPGFTYQQLLSGIFGQTVGLRQYTNNGGDRVNQEFRLASKPESTLFGTRFDWQVGGFYAREKIFLDQGFDVISIATNEILTVPFAGGSLEAPARYEEYAGFADATIYLSDNIDFSLGGRYTDNKQRSQIFFSAGFATGPDAVTTPITSNESKFTWQTALRWRFAEDSLLYGRIATGYRAGAPNFVTPGAPADIPLFYNADNTVNYELGLRTRLFDNAVDIDIAAFYIDWSDIQVATTFVSAVTGQFVTVIANGGTATSKGLEWNIGWNVTPDLRVSTVGAFTQAELSEDAPALGGEAGQQLPFVPAWSNTLNVDYERDLGMGVRGRIGGSWQYVGDRFTGFGSVPFFPSHIRMPDYSLFHAQAGLAFEKFDLSLFVRNIGNSRAVISYSPVGGFNNFGEGQIVPPRTIGLRLNINY